MATRTLFSASLMTSASPLICLIWSGPLNSTTSIPLPSLCSESFCDVGKLTCLYICKIPVFLILRNAFYHCAVSDIRGSCPHTVILHGYSFPLAQGKSFPND